MGTNLYPPLFQLNPHKTRHGNYSLSISVSNATAEAQSSDVLATVRLGVLRVPLIEPLTSPPNVAWQPPVLPPYADACVTVPPHARAVVSHVEHRFDERTAPLSVPPPPPPLVVPTSLLSGNTCAGAAAVARGQLRRCAPYAFAAARRVAAASSLRVNVSTLWRACPANVCGGWCRQGVVAGTALRHFKAGAQSEAVSLCFSLDAPLVCVQGVGASLLEHVDCAHTALAGKVGDVLWRQCGAVSAAAIRAMSSAPNRTQLAAEWASACAYGALRTMYTRCAAAADAQHTPMRDWIGEACAVSNHNATSTDVPLSYLHAFGNSSEAMLACRTALGEAAAISTNLNSFEYDALCDTLPDAPQSNADVGSPRAHCRRVARAYADSERALDEPPRECVQTSLHVAGYPQSISVRNDASLFNVNTTYWQPVSASWAERNFSSWLCVSNTLLRETSVRFALPDPLQQHQSSSTSSSSTSYVSATMASSSSSSSNSNDSPRDHATTNGAVLPPPPHSSVAPMRNERGCVAHCLRYCGTTASRLCLCGGARVPCDGVLRPGVHGETVPGGDDGPEVSTTGGGSSNSDWVVMLGVFGSLALCAVAVGGAALRQWRRKRRVSRV